MSKFSLKNLNMMMVPFNFDAAEIHDNEPVETILINVT